MSLRSETKAPKNKSGKRKRHLDEGEWDCVHCTFKNEPTNGKCEVCDIPRGTSTRRGGYNPQLVAQQELEEMLSKDRAKQKRVVKAARNVRNTTSFSPVPSNPSTPLPQRHPRRSPSPHLTDTSSMASPGPTASTSRSRRSPAKSNSTAGTSRVSEASSYDFSEIDPSPSSSAGPSPWKKLDRRAKLSTISASTTRSTPEKLLEKKPRGRPKKKLDSGASTSPGPSNKASTSGLRRQRKSVIFAITHEGVTLEFEEIIPTDVSDFDDSDDDLKSDES